MSQGMEERRFRRVGVGAGVACSGARHAFRLAVGLRAVGTIGGLTLVGFFVFVVQRLS